MNNATGSRSETSNQPCIGLAAEYALQRDLKLNVAIDQHRADFLNEPSRVRTFALGAQYDF